MRQETAEPQAGPSRANGESRPNTLAMVLGLALLIPGTAAPFVLLHLLGWIDYLREIGFPQNHWLFVGPLILVIATAWISSVKGRRRAAQYAAVILMQAAWCMGAAALAGVLLAAAGIRPANLPSVALLLFLAAPGFRAGTTMLRRWGIVRPLRRDPSDSLDIEICVAVSIPGILLGFAMIDLLQDFGIVAELSERRTGLAGIVLLPVFFALFGAHPATRRDWAVLVGTIVVIAALGVAVWALATVALAALALGEIVGALTATLPVFLPFILVWPILIAARRLAGPDGPWPRDSDPGAEETTEGAAR